MKKAGSRIKGQSIVETVVGIIAIVPVVLFLLDVAMVVLASTANDSLAKSVARAAATAMDTTANKGSSQAAYNAALAIANNFSESTLISKSTDSFVTEFCWNGFGRNETQGSTWSSPPPHIGDVAVLTTMRINLPVPFPFLPNSIESQAKAVEPITSIDSTAIDGGIRGGPGPGTDSKNHPTYF